MGFYEEYVDRFFSVSKVFAIGSGKFLEIATRICNFVKSFTRKSVEDDNFFFFFNFMDVNLI